MLTATVRQISHLPNSFQYLRQTSTVPPHCIGLQRRSHHEPHRPHFGTVPLAILRDRLLGRSSLFSQERGKRIWSDYRDSSLIDVATKVLGVVQLLHQALKNVSCWLADVDKVLVVPVDVLHKLYVA